jgi:hypothetical protein
VWGYCIDDQVGTELQASATTPVTEEMPAGPGLFMPTERGALLIPSYLGHRVLSGIAPAVLKRGRDNLCRKNKISGELAGGNIAMPKLKYQQSASKCRNRCNIPWSVPAKVQGPRSSGLGSKAGPISKQIPASMVAYL